MHRLCRWIVCRCGPRWHVLLLGQSTSKYQAPRHLSGSKQQSHVDSTWALQTYCYAWIRCLLCLWSFGLCLFAGDTCSWNAASDSKAISCTVRLQAPTDCAFEECCPTHTLTDRWWRPPSLVQDDVQVKPPSAGQSHCHHPAVDTCQLSTSISGSTGLGCPTCSFNSQSSDYQVSVSSIRQVRISLSRLVGVLIFWKLLQD